jgi:Lrp/AsnC family transcriptional regulator, regulator for asnA, asnC and gidA
MYEIDETDRQIIDLLLEDGRMKSAEIARRLEGESSERSIRYRINRMVEEGIINISAVVHPRTLGYQVIADVFVEVEPGKIYEVAQTLAAHELVSYVACSIGERDISAQVVAHDNGEVYAFATEFIGRLPGVRKTTTSIVPIRMKDVYQWRVPRSAVERASSRKEG